MQDQPFAIPEITVAGDVETGEPSPRGIEVDLNLVGHPFLKVGIEIDGGPLTPAEEVREHDQGLRSGGAATTRAHAQPASTPDTYVTYWDAVGSQAFTAAALPAPDGFLIFANVGIAVYDSLMAIEGGYQPFAVDVDSPEGASAQAAVAAAAQ